MQKVYVTEEQKEKILEKLNRDVEVGEFKDVVFVMCLVLHDTDVIEITFALLRSTSLAKIYLPSRHITRILYFFNHP